MERVEAILRDLSQERLATLIRRLARDEGAGPSVAWPTLLEALLEGRPLPEGPEGGRAELALRRAVQERVAQIPGLRYVPGDS